MLLVDCIHDIHSGYSKWPFLGSWPKKQKEAESVKERKKNKSQVPAGDDDYGGRMFDVWKSLSPPLNVNKQLAAVTNTDKREINCGDRQTHTERGRKRGKMITADTKRERTRGAEIEGRRQRQEMKVKR